jgi:hypothetical protein
MVILRKVSIDRVDVGYYIFIAIIWPFAVIILIAAMIVWTALFVIELLYGLLTF